MTLDLEAIRAEAEKEMSPEWLEAYGDASRAAALHALGEPVPLELERKASVQIKKNAEHPQTAATASEYRLAGQGVPPATQSWAVSKD